MPKSESNQFIRRNRCNTKLSPRKFTLSNKVEFGGFRISHDLENDLVLVQPSEEKVQALQSIQAPKSKQEVQSLVGFLSQLSNFVPECKTVIPNIKRLTSKYNTFKWSSVEEEEFQEVKKRLQSIVPVSPIDVSKPLMVYCDASNSGIGWILTQKKNNDLEMDENWMSNQVVIEMGSVSLSDCQARYSPVEKECLAAFTAITKLDY